ncbi:MAG: zf-HC2 domain-containing protein [Anaerolineales bacterium]|jgi:predicted anti-sigma-YlaC factor YlaD
MRAKEQSLSQCQSLLAFLSDFVDGTLSEELCQEIRSHATECEHCRIVVDTLRKTISLYHECADETAEIPHEVRSQLFKTLNLQDYLE